jgi:ankyrin repeat protein
MAMFLHGGLSHLSDKVDNLTDRFVGLQLNLTTQKAGRDQILNWLRPVFTDENYEAALTARLDGTCHWVLQRPEFQAWTASNPDSEVTKFLWIHGPPGSGKTILSASTVQYLLGHCSASVSFFFSVGEDESKRDPQTVVRSWVAQMIRKDDIALEAAREAYAGKGTQPATQLDLRQLFRTISQRVPNCFYILDGLDECAKYNSLSRAHTLDSRIRFLQELIVSAAQTGSHILIVSRYDADIKFHFKNNSTESHPDLFYEYEISKQDTRNDIASFSNYVVEQKLPNKPAALKQEIAKEAADRCDGMFLWIRLLNDRLSRGKNAKQLRKVVSETPVGLEKAYERDLGAILELSEDERRRAVAILRWILFASRPLTVKELTEALLVDADNDGDAFPVDDLPDPCDEEYADDQITRLCGSLVHIRTGEWDCFEESTVHFVHFSVKEYLSQTSEVSCRTPSVISFPNSNAEHDLLARTCLHYLSYDDFKLRRHSTFDELSDKLGQYAFLSYASLSWYGHAGRGKTDSQELHRLTNRFFHPTDQRWLLWSDVFEDHQSNFKALRLRDGSEGVYGNPFYYASILGLVETLEYLQSNGVDVNVEGGHFGNALQASAARGNDHVVEFLLKQKAEVNLQGGKYGTAIVAAAAECPRNEARKIIQRLLDAGAAVQSHDDGGTTPLHFAARGGDEKILELLMDRGSDISATDSNGDTALIFAAVKGHESVVKLLLARGADLKIRNKAGQTVLHRAAEQNKADIVKALLENGAEIEAEDENGCRALHLSAGTKGYTTTKLLLDSRADVHAATKTGLTALHIAAAAKDNTIVKLLLEKGANANATMEHGSTPLHAAAYGGGEAVVRALFRYGNIDLNARDVLGQTALLMAAKNGHTTVVKLLLEQDGIDLDIENASGQTALFCAAAGGHFEVAKLLLAQTRDLDLRDKYGNTPLDYAAERGAFVTMRELLKQGAGFSAYAYSLALRSTPQSKNRIAMQQLEKMVLDVETWINGCEDTLQVACMEGHLVFVELLLSIGADPNKVDEHGWIPLLCASHAGQDSILECLLSSGGDINLLDNALTLSPTSWSEVVKSTCLELDSSRNNVRYVGKLNFSCRELSVLQICNATPVESSNAETKAATVRANHPVPLHSSSFYFEITVIDGGERRYESISRILTSG